MQYLLLMISTDEPAPGAGTYALPAPGPDEPCWMPWYRDTTARGIVVGDGARLEPDTPVTMVTVAGRDVLVSDGPFAETKEPVVGYQTIECDSLAEAVRTAARHPVAESGGRIEIRPILAG
jgi:hypothetical protein